MATTKQTNHLISQKPIIDLETASAVPTQGNNEVAVDKVKGLMRKPLTKMKIPKTTPFSKSKGKPTNNTIKRVNKQKEAKVKQERDNKISHLVGPEPFLPQMFGTGLFQSISELNATTKQLAEVVNKTDTSAVDTIIANLSSLSENINTNMDKDFIKKISKDLPDLGTEVLTELSGLTRTLNYSCFGVTLFMGGAAFCCWQKGMGRSWGIISLVCFAISIAGCPEDIKENIAEFIAHVISRLKNQETPTVQIDSAALNNISLACIALLTGASSKDLKTSKWTQVLRFFERKESTVRSFKDVLQLFMSTMEYIVNAGLALCGSEKVVQYVKSCRKDIDNFELEVAKLHRRNAQGKLPLTKASFDDVMALYHKGISLQADMPRDSLSAGLMTALATVMRGLSNLVEVFQRQGFTFDGTRQEPVGVMLFGLPGTCKSNATMFLHLALCKRLLPKEHITEFNENPYRFMYNRTPEQGYWDGYDDLKFVTIIDDFGQIRDVAGNPDNEFMNIIRAINEFPYALHMASIEKKASTYFNSKFVIATTNMKLFEPQSVTCREALIRRFDHYYEVQPKPEFARKDENGRVFADAQKFPIGPRGEPDLTPEMIQFVRTNMPGSQSVKGESSFRVTMSFDEVVDELCEAYHKKERRYEQKAMTNTRLMDVQMDLPDEDKEKSAYSKNSFSYRKNIRTHIVDVAFPYNIICFEKFCDTKQQLLQIEKILQTWFLSEPTDPDRILLTSRLGKLHKATRETVGTVNPSLIQMIKIFGNYHDTYDDWDMLDITDIEFEDTIDRMYMHYVDMGSSSTEKYIAQCVNPLMERALPKYEEARKSLYNRIVSFAQSTFMVVYEFCQKYGKILLVAASLIGVLWAGKKVLCESSENDENTEEDAQSSILNYLDADSDFRSSGNLDNNKGNQIDHSFSQEHVKDNDVTQSMDMSGKNRDRRNPAALRAKAKKGTIGVQMAQTSAPGVDAVLAKVMRNSYEMWLEIEPEEFRRSGFVTFVSERNLLMPYHFYSMMFLRIDEDDEFLKRKILFKRCKAETPAFPAQHEITVGEFIQGVAQHKDSENVDYTLVRLPSRFPNFPSIIKHFPEAKQYNVVRDWVFRLDYPIRGEKERVCGVARKLEHGGLPYTTPFGDDVLLQKGFQYSVPCAAGDCGALFSVLSSNIKNGTVYGIHTCGQQESRNGFSTFVFREGLQYLVTCLDDHFSQHDEFVNQVHNDEKVLVQMKAHEVPERFELARVLNKPVFSSTYTCIRQSPLHGAWGKAITKPAHLKPFLSNGVWIDPYQIALSKYCIGENRVGKDILTICANAYQQYIFSNAKIDCERRVFSLEEAILGLEEDPDFSAISRSTSCGFPFVQDPMYAGSGKFKVFGSDEVYDLSNPVAQDFMLRCQRIIDSAKQGIREEHVYIDCLKDEKLLISKVDKGKARLFCASPFDYLAVVRMYFGAFTIWFLKNNIDIGSALGINPYSKDWHRLAMKLLEKDPTGNSTGAGDYSGYDGSCKAIIHWLIFDIICAWYGPGNEEDNQVRYVLWQDLVNSKHVRNDVIYVWNGSLPSGHGLTALVNTMYGQIIMRYAWCDIFGENEITANMFNDHVYLVDLGDDHVFEVEKEYRDDFNEAAIGQSMEKLGMIYTPESKQGELCAELRNITEVEFLKRKFKKFNGEWIAPLRLEVVLEMPYWTKKGDKELTIVQDNVQNCLDELALHGKEIFEEYGPQIVNACSTRLHWYPKRTLWNTCFEFVTSRDEFW